MPIKALLFDWGNTLMRDIPGQTGAMAYWPAVEAIPNTADALEGLSRVYPLYIATNAADSNAALVSHALARVKLNSYIKKVFTSSEIGQSKDSPEFYLQVANLIGVDPECMVMIGDNFNQDVCQAQSAGLNAIWFNQDGSRAVPVLPFQDGEIFSLLELEQVLARGFPPGVAACDQIHSQYQVPENVKNHMCEVAQFTYHLALALKKKAIDVDPILAHRAAYLHDLDKLLVGDEPANHGQVSAGLLRKRGYLRLADLIEGHVLEKILINPSFYQDWTAMLVYYADKRFDGDNFVTVAERCHRLQTRYPQSAEKIRAALPHILALELEISGVLHENLDCFH